MKSVRIKVYVVCFESREKEVIYFVVRSRGWGSGVLGFRMGLFYKGGDS